MGLSRKMNNMIKDGRNRKDIYPGIEVYIVKKEDQRTGKYTRGIVKELLTKSAYHPRGIKVRLEDGQIGRVHKIQTYTDLGLTFPKKKG